MVVELAGEDRGALRPADGENLAIAARPARDQRLPLVCFVESSGAELRSVLPDHTDQVPVGWPCADPVDRPTPEAGDLVPDTATGSYDVRDVLACVVDGTEAVVQQLRGLGGRELGVVAYLALLSTLLGYGLWTRLLQRYAASTVARARAFSRTRLLMSMS